MEVSGEFEEEISPSLLEDVFGVVESSVESSNPMTCDTSPITFGSTFLKDELQCDLDAAFGRKQNLKVRKSLTGEDKKSKEEPSLIHEGELSDSEGERFYTEDNNHKKYITSRSILGNDFAAQSHYSDGIQKNGKKWIEFKSNEEKLNKNKILKSKELTSSSNDPLVDPVFHMHIINPKVSTLLLKNKMLGREAVPPWKIKKFLETKDLKEINWVTGGAVIGKFITKSQKGNQYCIWNLSDLKGDIKVISVFLFGTAYREFWKIPLGIVVGILNPSLLDNKNNKSEATLRVDNSDKIMIFGTSRDYGICKSIKANGDKCTAVVNKSSCEYCVYHVKQAYDKASRRQELQASFTGNGLTTLRNKVLGRNEVFYGGKLYAAVKGTITPRNVHKEQKCLKMSKNPSADSIKAKKDFELIKRLNGEKDKNNSKSSTMFDMEKIKSSKKIHNGDQEILKDVAIENFHSHNLNLKKKIDLDMPITSKQILRAKANALKYIRQKGPLKKPLINNKTKTKTEAEIAVIKRKIEAQDEQVRKKIKTENNNLESKDPLKEKLKRSGITEKFLNLMKSKSEDVELLNDAESEENEKYFKRLEIREKMEVKMASTYKVDCKAVRCLKCNYKSFNASEYCKKERHPLKVVNAVKRFWKCGDCSARTVCLELVPLHSCKVCGSSKWIRTCMLPEKKDPLLTRETLSIRGHEEKFVGSCVRNPNINLLIPDEES